MKCIQSIDSKESFFRVQVCHNLDTGVKAPSLNGKRKLDGVLGNLLLELVDLGDLSAGDLGLKVLQSVGLLWKAGLHILANLNRLVNVLGNLLEVLLSETTRGHGGSTDTDTVGSKSRLVARNSVLVAGNVDLLKNSLNTSAIELVLAEIEQDHVRISTISHHLLAESLECVLEGLGVRGNLLLVGLELGCGSLLQGHSQSSDGVVMGTALMTREDGKVDNILKVVQDLLAGFSIDGTDTFAEEDHGTTWATKTLVGGGRDNIGVEERRGNNLSSNQTRNVSHVDDKVGTNRVGDLAHTLVIDEAAVGRGTCNESLGAEELDILFEHIVVNDAGLFIYTVGHRFEISRDSRDPTGLGVSQTQTIKVANSHTRQINRRCQVFLLALRSLITVGQVTTVGQVKTHKTIMGLHDSLVDLKIGRAAGEGLNIDTPLVAVNVESLKSTLLAEKLDLVNVLVATIVTHTGITFGVFVGHGRAQSVVDSTRSNVLRSNENDRFTLAFNFSVLY